MRVNLKLCQRPCFLTVFPPLSSFAQTYLYEIYACDKNFAHRCKALALAGGFRGFFYNNVLLQPKLTKPESLINIKWSWVCNNLFSLLCCLRVSWLWLLGLIMGGSGKGEWAYKWFCLAYWSSVTRHLQENDVDGFLEEQEMQLWSYTAVLFKLGMQRSKELCTIKWALWREERDSEDRGVQTGIMSLLFLLTRQMWGVHVEPRGCNIQQLQCFPSFWGIVRHREWYK